MPGMLRHEAALRFAVATEPSGDRQQPSTIITLRTPIPAWGYDGLEWAAAVRLSSKFRLWENIETCCYHCLENAIGTAQTFPPGLRKGWGMPELEYRGSSAAQGPRAVVPSLPEASQDFRSGGWRLGAWGVRFRLHSRAR